MTILRPIARVEEALSLDRVVNIADRVIGKSGTPGGSAIGISNPAPPSTSSTPKSGGGTQARLGVGKASSTTTTPVVKAVGPPPIHQPSASHPLTVLDVGDSIGEDLGIGLANALANVAGVNLLRDAVGDTGLANLGYYNWLVELKTELAAHHPQAVVVLLGGDDAQSFQAGNLVVQFGTPEWHLIYSERVSQMMTEATSAGAHVMWVGLPIMGPTSGLSNTDMQEENNVFASEAALHPGVTFVSSWKLFENAQGQYTTYLIEGGGSVQVRDPDETHIDPPGGTDIIGNYVVKAMEQAWHIKL